MPPINNLPIVVQRGSYRLQLSNLKITDDELPALLQRATSELTNSYSQSQGKRGVFADVPLIEVTFNKNNITDQSCAAIVDFIAQNSHIQSVEMLGNGLTDASAHHIVRMITTLPVQRLKVGDNTFTAAGAGIIAAALVSSHKGFLQLHIGGNPIGDEGVRVLCEACQKSKVEVLGLRDVAFGVDGWEALGAVVASPTTGVHDFQLRGNNFSLACATAFANGIGRSAFNTTHAYKLTVLSVGNCGIEGATSQALFSVLDRAHNLVQIDLSNNPLGDDGLQHLVQWLASGHRNHLQWLSLQKAAITAAGIQSMTAGSQCDTVLKSLKYIDFSLNNLGEGGAPAVATIIQWGMALEKINLRRCMLAGPRLAEICSALNHHPSLKEVDFASNFSGTENAKHWADIIFATTKLEHLVLTDNAFTSDDTAEIVQSLLTTSSRCISVLQLGGQSHVPPLGNVITPPIISKLNEALSRNRQHVNDTKRPAAAFHFDPVKLRQSMGYPLMPVPVPMPGPMHPDCVPLHPQLLQGYPNGANMLQQAGGNFMCFAPTVQPQQPQQPQYFMCTPLAGPAVYGACSSASLTSPYTVKLIDPTSPHVPTPFYGNQFNVPQPQIYPPLGVGGHTMIHPHQQPTPPYAAFQQPAYNVAGKQGLPTPPAYTPPAALGVPPNPQPAAFPTSRVADASQSSSNNSSAAHPGGYIGDTLGAGMRPFADPAAAHNIQPGNANTSIFGAAYYGIDYMI